jgi:hypothetical protein
MKSDSIAYAIAVVIFLALFTAAAGYVHNKTHHTPGTYNAWYISSTAFGVVTALLSAYLKWHTRRVKKILNGP